VLVVACVAGSGGCARDSLDEEKLPGRFSRRANE
jgi:hypothetical protein